MLSTPATATAATAALAAAALALLPSLTRATDLATDGHSDFAIVYAQNPRPADRRAATEIQSHLKLITGANFRLVADGSLPPHAILLGNLPQLASLNVTLDPKSLGDEGFLLKTVGDRLVLAGATPRATLYACDEFLERLGVRFAAPDVTRCPDLPTLPLPAFDEAQSPSFEYREPFISEAFQRDWAVHLRINGDQANLDDSTGGHVIYGLKVHTLDYLVPRDLYKTHPEYFPLINGKRVDGYVQRCLTNPDVLKITIANLEKAIKENPKAKIFSVSQNDTGSWCTCDNCTALTKKYGAHSGLYLHFANQVADAIAKDHPDILIDTLAYQFTEAPPHGISPRPNVRVRLCPISNCFSHPFQTCTDPADVAFMQHLNGWATLTGGNLYIWHYNTDFANYLMPFPDFTELAADIPMYHQHGVRGVFLEGDYSPGGGGSDDVLRAYLVSHLLWNDHADPNQLIDDWMNGIYGPAANPMRQWFDLLHDRVKPQTSHLKIYDPCDKPFLLGDTLARGNDLLDHAQLLAGSDPVADKYIKKQRLSLRYVQLKQHPTDGPELTDFLRDVRAAGITAMTEGMSVDKWQADYLARLNKNKKN